MKWWFSKPLWQNSPSSHPSSSTLSLRLGRGWSQFQLSCQGASPPKPWPIYEAHSPVIYYPYITISYPCLCAAGCCCWDWAASGLWTSGTAGASDVWCCSQTGPSWRCQSAARTECGPDLWKTDRATKHKTPFLQRGNDDTAKNLPLGYLGNLQIWSAAVAPAWKSCINPHNILKTSKCDHIDNNISPWWVTRSISFMACEALMYKPVSSTYSNDDGCSQGLKPVKRSLKMTWSFVVWRVFDNKLQQSSKCLQLRIKNSIKAINYFTFEYSCMWRSPQHVLIYMEFLMYSEKFAARADVAALCTTEVRSFKSQMTLWKYTHTCKHIHA